MHYNTDFNYMLVSFFSVVYLPQLYTCRYSFSTIPPLKQKTLFTFDKLSDVLFSLYSVYEQVVVTAYCSNPDMRTEKLFFSCNFLCYLTS